MSHFDVFLKVNSPRFVGKLTSKVNSRSEYATEILLVLWCKIIELIWVLVNSLVVPAALCQTGAAVWQREVADLLPRRTCHSPASAIHVTLLQHSTLGSGAL